jgi:hypothetical protein
MELYGGNFSHTQEILRTKTYEVPQQFPLKRFEDISDSVTNIHHKGTSLHTTLKTNFEPLKIDSIIHKQRYDVTDPSNNRDIHTLIDIDNSRKPMKPHNTFASDFTIIDY